MLVRLLTVTAASTLLSTVSATCYWPTGNATYDRDLYEHQPCSNDTTSPLNTICCALNRTNPSGGDSTQGRTNDVCLPNGICENKVLVHGTLQTSYWRETCTEKDWKKGLCLDVCSDAWSSGNLTTGAIMTPCDDTPGSLRWCCGTDKSCCNDDSKVKLIPFEFRGALPNTASATPNPWTTATSTPTSTAKVNDEGLSTGGKAGVGVGAAVGGLALIGMGFLLARRTMGKRQDQSHQAIPQRDYSGEWSTPVHSPQPLPEKAVWRHELQPSEPRGELPYSPHNPQLAAYKAEASELP